MTKVSCGLICVGKVGNLTLGLLRDFSVLAAPQPLGSLPLLCWPQTPLRRTSGNQWSSEHSVRIASRHHASCPGSCAHSECSSSGNAFPTPLFPQWLEPGLRSRLWEKHPLFGGTDWTTMDLGWEPRAGAILAVLGRSLHMVSLSNSRPGRRGGRRVGQDLQLRSQPKSRTSICCECHSPGGLGDRTAVEISPCTSPRKGIYLPEVVTTNKVLGVDGSYTDH